MTFGGAVLPGSGVTTEDEVHTPAHLCLDYMVPGSQTPEKHMDTVHQETSFLPAPHGPVTHITVLCVPA